MIIDVSPMIRQVNKDFFKNWTAEMSYVLGFFAADGYMWISGRGAYFFGFNITDEELLKSIKYSMSSTHKIARRVYKNNKWKDSFRLQIGSKEMFNDLLKLGMTPNKTHTLNMPNIPNKYFVDFVRGYFDGDGHVWVGEIHKDRGNSNKTIQTVFTSGSKDFLLGIRSRLSDIGLTEGVFINKSRAYRLQYSVKDSIMLSHLMYDRCTNDLFLKRKRDKFEKYINTKRV